MARTKTPRNGDAGNKPVASTSQIAFVSEVKKNFSSVDIEAEIRRRAYELYKSAEARRATRTRIGWLRNARYWLVIISSRVLRFTNPRFCPERLRALRLKCGLKCGLWLKS